MAQTPYVRAVRTRRWYAPAQTKKHRQPINLLHECQGLPMHILIIEDDLELGLALSKALKANGLTCEWLRRIKA